VLQPILIRPLRGEDARYELVAGERRWRAAQLAGKTEIPAIAREMADDESLAVALVENLQREDLNAMEEAAGFAQLQERFGLTQDDLAKRVGKSRPAIANAVRLLQLPPACQEDIRANRLSAGHGRALLAIGDEAARETLRGLILSRGLSVREAEALANHWKSNGNFPESLSVQTAPARVGHKRSPRVADPEALALRDRLRDILGLGVSLRGALDKGELVLAFATRDELAQILERLGVDLPLPDQAEVQEALSGAEG
jgi:ParB family transcriptional regulator, chromosome partitioning protein